jgi:hypothetical protein
VDLGGRSEDGLDYPKGRMTGVGKVMAIGNEKPTCEP